MRDDYRVVVVSTEGPVVARISGTWAEHSREARTETERRRVGRGVATTRNDFDGPTPDPAA